MDRLVARIVLTDRPRHLGPATARHLLYIRSHWLRMPPLLLARHLATKAALRLRGPAPANQAGR
jgi:hypothetical protein